MSNTGGPRLAGLQEDAGAPGMQAPSVPRQIWVVKLELLLISEVRVISKIGCDAKGCWETRHQVALPDVCSHPGALTLSFQDETLTYLNSSLKSQFGIWTLGLFGRFIRAFTQEGGAFVKHGSMGDSNGEGE